MEEGDEDGEVMRAHGDLSNGDMGLACRAAFGRLGAGGIPCTQ